MQQTILITNQLDTGSAFALTDQMENVFIPSKVMNSKPARPGQKVQAIVVPNATHGHKTPWMAVTILDDAPIQPPQPQPRRDTLADLILDDLRQGRATSDEIAESLNMTDESIEAKLADLVAAGRVVRLTCFDLPEDAA
jgi:predicted Rossmann fold nucleotide-binding protein DprA/Smf involved in DNA uptake